MRGFSTADKLQQKELQRSSKKYKRSTKKEVRKQDRSTNSYLCILQHIYSGIQPATISKLEGISKTTLQYHLDKLKLAGAIRKIGYGTWEVSDTAIFDLKRSTKEVQITSKKYKRSTKKEVQIQGRSTNSNLCIGTNSKYKTADKLSGKQHQIQDPHLHMLPPPKNNNINLMLYILKQLKSGARASQIQHQLAMKQTTYQYHLTKLKQVGAITKIGYGVWEVSDTAYSELERTSNLPRVGKATPPHI